MKRAAIVQSSYIPWKGYFDLIRAVDEFVLFDDAPYQRQNWRNRNALKTSDGSKWLTIPIATKGLARPPVHQVEVVGSHWTEKHWRMIVHCYTRAPHFSLYAERLEELYAQARMLRKLSEVNRLFIEAICDWLGVKTRLSWSMDYDVSGDKHELGPALCRAVGATSYLSGPSAKSYIEPGNFAENGIELCYADYTNYPVYPQLHTGFVHELSVLDLLFNTGPDALKYMKQL